MIDTSSFITDSTAYPNWVGQRTSTTTASATYDLRYYAVTDYDTIADAGYVCWNSFKDPLGPDDDAFDDDVDALDKFVEDICGGND